MIPLLLIGISAVIITALGGIFTLYFKDRLHLIVGFSAGAVLGVAFFHLLPEAFELGKMYEPSFISAIIAIGFLLYLLIDRTLSLKNGRDHEHRGTIGAASFVMHSLLDGLAIGFAFQVSAAVGAVVTFAVLTHAFSDGINTVNFALFDNKEEHRAWWWLSANGAARILGIVATFWIIIPESIFALLIALFTGFFLYLGASELVPESHHRHPHFWTTAMTVFGMGVIFLMAQLVSH